MDYKVKNQIIIDVKNDLMYCYTLIELCYHINNNKILTNRLIMEDMEIIKKINTYCKIEIARINLALTQFKESIIIPDREFQNLSKNSVLLRSEVKRYYSTLKLYLELNSVE